MFTVSLTTAETHFLERDEMQGLLRNLPRTGRHAQRDHALILFLYNTGARAQEVAELRAGNLQLGEHALVRLHGKGDKWRTCPLWDQTAKLLATLRDSSGEPIAGDAPVFRSATGEALTRFGIYKVVRRVAAHLDDAGTNRTVSPHVFRHTAVISPALFLVRDVGYVGEETGASRVSGTCRCPLLCSFHERVDQLFVSGRAGGVCA